MNAQELLHNCPFCGSKADIWLKENRLGVFVECDNMDCGARSGTFMDINEAISKWNLRYNVKDKEDK